MITTVVGESSDVASICEAPYGMGGGVESLCLTKEPLRERDWALLDVLFLSIAPP